MYSIVMIAAMTAAPEVPDFFKKKGGGCNGCYGCAGGYGGCYGGFGGCAGCMGSSCQGGYGGGFCGFAKSSCHGCQGYASAYGTCHGYAPYAGCCGGFGIGAYGPPVYTMSGYGSPGGSVPYVSPTTPATAVDVPVAISSLPTDKAQVVVRVPADAKLFADGAATSLTGTERVFLTPALTAGKDFTYTLKAEYAVNGEVKSATKQVVVRAGHRTVVDFVTLPPPKASSSVLVNLPEKAKLFVDGVATTATGGKHTFRTPELAKDRPYVYEFRAEVEKDGKTETLTRNVTFRAGDLVTVDFTEADATRTASAK
jgi:uncharacterized protein (TIGR03000 family)